MRIVNESKCVCGRYSTPNPAGGAYRPPSWIKEWTKEGRGLESGRRCKKMKRGGKGEGRKGKERAREEKRRGEEKGSESRKEEKEMGRNGEERRGKGRSNPASKNSGYALVYNLFVAFKCDI